jgi:SAM-dependent methyltransferase
MAVLRAIKTVVKRAVFPKATTRPRWDAFYARFPPECIAERTVFVGARRMRVRALQMQSVPGTAEVVVSLLDGFPRTDTVLDYGCGTHGSRYLRTLDFPVHSCDTKDFDFPNHIRIEPDAPLPFPDERFDVTVCSEVVEHVEDPWTLLRELRRVTRKALIVTTPNVVSLKSREVFARTGYLHWFTPDVDYHVTPVFFWQLERFCRREGIPSFERHGNQELFDIPGTEDPLLWAECLVYRLNLRA